MLQALKIMLSRHCNLKGAKHRAFFINPIFELGAQLMENIVTPIAIKVNQLKTKSAKSFCDDSMKTNATDMKIFICTHYCLYYFTKFLLLGLHKPALIFRNLYSNRYNVHI